MSTHLLNTYDNGTVQGYMIKWVTLTIPKKMHRHCTTYSHALSSPSLQLTLFAAEQQNYCNPPRPPPSTCSCSSTHPYPTHGQEQIEMKEDVQPDGQRFFWYENSSKTRWIDLSGPPEKKIVTSVSILGWAHLLLQNCGYWWLIMASSHQKERSSIFYGLSTFLKRIQGKLLSALWLGSQLVRLTQKCCKNTCCHLFVPWLILSLLW